MTCVSKSVAGVRGGTVWGGMLAWLGYVLLWLGCVVTWLGCGLVWLGCVLLWLGVYLYIWGHEVAWLGLCGGVIRVVW